MNRVSKAAQAFKPAIAALKRCATPAVVIAYTLLTVGAQAFKPANAGLKPRATTEEAQSGNDLFQRALSKERAEGQLDEAIRIYERIVKEFAIDRSIVAKALVQMGGCYERLGKSEARNIYDRLVREFADQKEAAADARTRLAAMAPAKNGAGMASKRLWAGDDVNVLGSISPDGRYFLYADQETGGPVVRALATGDKRALTNASWASGGFALFPNMSPDGKHVAYVWFTDGLFELRTVRFEGGQPRLLYRNEEVAYIQYYDWSPDGQSLLALFTRKDGTSQIALVRAADGSLRVLKSLGWSFPMGMSFSPDSRYIAYDFPPKQDRPERDILVLAADGSREVPLVSHPANDVLLGWAPNGRQILFASDRSGTRDAWLMPVADGKPVGTPDLVKRDVGRLWSLGFSRKGTFYYALQSGMRDVYIANLDVNAASPIGPPQAVSQRFEGANFDPDWSPDGRRLAFISQRGDRAAVGSRVLVIHSVKAGEERDLSLKKMSALQRPRWHPDGRSFLADGTDERGRSGLFRIDAETGEPALLLQNRSQGQESFAGWAVWSPDGRAIFYQHSDFKAKLHRILRFDMETGQQQELSRGPSQARLIAPSPDGRQLAFLTQGSIKVISVTTPDALGELLKEKVTWMAWTHDGHLLALKSSTDGTGELWRISPDSGEAHRLGPAVKGMVDARLHPDGRRVVFSTPGDGKTEVWALENFLPVEKATAARR